MRWFKLSLELNGEQSSLGKVGKSSNESSDTDFGVSKQPVQSKQNNSVKAIRNSLSSENSYAISNSPQSGSDLPLKPRSIHHFKRKHFSSFPGKFKESHGSTQSLSSVPVLLFHMTEFPKANCGLADSIASRNAEGTNMRVRTTNRGYRDRARISSSDQQRSNSNKNVRIHNPGIPLKL